MAKKKKESVEINLEEIIGDGYSNQRSRLSESNIFTELSKNVKADNSNERNNKPKTRKALEEYSNLFLITPKIVNRKTVFISEELRNQIDEIARRLGDRKMSASGFLENLVRHHLETYQEELEKWKKL